MSRIQKTKRVIQMRKRVMDIFNRYRAEIRRAFLTCVSYNKIGNKQSIGFFSLFIFLLFVFCVPASVCAEETGGAATYIDSGSILVPVLLLLVVSLLVIIVGLVVCLRHQKGKLRKSHEYLVRYITSNLELRKQNPGLKEPYPFNPPEITPQEFIKVMDNMLKRIMFLSLIVLLALPVAVQDTADAAMSYLS